MTVNWTARSIESWNDLAQDWDDRDSIWIEGPRADVLQFFFRFIGEQPVKVLDLGCGPGESVRLMKDKGYLAIGVDQSPQMIKTAKKREVEAYVSLCDPLPFANGEFDAVFACTSLEWSPEPHKIVKEMVRVLKPGGRLVAVTAAPWAHTRESGYDRLYGQEVIHNMMMPWEMHRLLQEHGLQSREMFGAYARKNPIPQSVLQALQENWVAQASLAFLWAIGFVKPE